MKKPSEHLKKVMQEIQQLASDENADPREAWRLFQENRQELTALFFPNGVGVEWLEEEPDDLGAALPLSCVIAVEPDGLLYRTEDGHEARIPFEDAYQGWCRTKQLKPRKPKYVCDRARKGKCRLLTFYLEEAVSFCADEADEQRWIEVLNEMQRHGWASMDMD